MTIPHRLHTFDLVLIVVYLLGITLFGLRFRKSGPARGKESSDTSLRSYFLAGNTVPWWAIALSIVSAETSTLTIISVPGIAFGGDFGFLQIVFGYLIGRIVVAVLFLPLYFQGRMMTAYQLIAQRFGPTLHKVTAGLFLLTRAAAEGVRVFAVSIVVGIAIGTRDVLSIGIISALTLLYTFEGGMTAVIWTDVVQMTIYIGGTLVAIFTLGVRVPGGWTRINAVAGAAGKFHLFHFAFNFSQSYTFWAGLLGGAFLTMASHGTDQLMVQRMLAARSLRESRLALLSSGVVILVQFTLFLLIGAGLYVFYGADTSGLPSPDRLFPTFIVAEMPPGIAGLLVAAILAAAMSNLSAALNSLSSTTIIDFYMPWKAKQSQVKQGQARENRLPSLPTPRHRTEPTLPSTTAERERAILAKASTVFWAVILFAVAVYSVHAGGKGHVVEIGLSIASVAYGALLGVFLLGTLTQYATQTGAICGMIVGFAFNLTLWLHPAPIDLGLFTIPHIAFTWYVFLGALVTFAIGTIASLLFRRRTKIATAIPLLLCIAITPFARSQSRGALFFVPHAKGGVDNLPSTPNTVVLSEGIAAVEGPASGVAQLSPTRPDFTPISTLLNEAVVENKIPGAVVLIGHDNKIVFEQAYGLRKLAGEPGIHGESTAEPMTEDTLFDMASLSKCLSTATAIMQLYEAHKLAFDDPVAKYLPAFAANGKQNVTIRELLTHYSGLPPDIDIKDPWGLAAPDNAEGIRRALASPLATEPGKHFVYSDINFITLGALVEKLSGLSLDEYAQQHIFMPLDMVHTRYLPFAKACGPKVISGSAISLPQPETGVIGNTVSRTNPLYSCPPGKTWIPSAVIPQTAPTAHDDESKSNPQLNPDFDHLLRGTVHDPTTRRMGGVAGHAGVFSTAEDVGRYAQALLEKLTRNTGPFPLKQSTLQLMTQPEQPATAESTATIFTPNGQLTKGVATRGFGWDINTAFARARGEIFPIAETGKPGSFGHTGFTGTSLWMDPISNTYVILLSNANHPRGGGPAISNLRGQVATIAARALNLDACHQPNTFCDPAISEASLPMPSGSDRGSRGAPLLVGVESRVSGEARPSSPKPAQPTLTGIDVLEATHFATLAEIAKHHNGHLRIGILTNQTGLDSHGRRTIDILEDAILQHVLPGVELTTLFSPEHGIFGKQDSTSIAAETDPVTHLPVLSLYGAHDADRRPKPADLAKLDAIVIDLQDAGVRFYTYATVTGYFVEASAVQAAAGHTLELIVLDRPDLIGGVAVQGPTSDPAVNAYVNYMPLPSRYGLTLGELARYINGEKHLNANLTVIPMQQWRRIEFFNETGLSWTNPSPNLRSLTAAILYPGVAFVETTNVSVGRGTATPFEHIGADYINASELAAYLTARHIPGVSIAPTTLTIDEDRNHYPYHGQTIPGVHFTLDAESRRALDSPELGLELAAALHHLYPTQFNLAKAITILASASTLQALEGNQDPRTIAAGWATSLDSFRQRRLQYLLYP